MTGFAEHFAEDRRLCILKVLERAPEYRANSFLLQAAIANLGHSVSHDMVRTDLAWLTEQGLMVTASRIGSTIATLTARGVDVAAGRASVPGVKRPLPGEDA